MKTKHLLIVVLFALGGLLFIQFEWIYNAALRQEKQFEYTVMAALNKSVVQLDKEESLCLELINCFNQKGYSCCDSRDITSTTWFTIDSLIQAELSVNKISIPYQFDLSTKPHPDGHKISEEKHKCFTVKTQMTTNQKLPIWIHVNFPGRNAFIIAQIGGLFLSSIVLIALLVLAFILIYKSYTREQKLAADTRNFINNLTHELKTPVSSIQLANSRILKNLEKESRLTTYSRIIDEETRKMGENINYLLDLSRLQKGMLPFNSYTVSMHQTIENVVKTMGLQVEDKVGELLCDLKAEQDVIEGDCFHLSNLLNNLLDNAIKYTNGAPEIKISTFNKAKFLYVSISDNGIGIESDDQKLIFREFSRVNTGDVHNVKGFGLGLSYVAQVVSLMKGKLKLESKPGVGSTFTIKLPLSNSKTKTQGNGNE